MTKGANDAQTVQFAFHVLACTAWLGLDVATRGVHSSASLPRPLGQAAASARVTAGVPHPHQTLSD